MIEGLEPYPAYKESGLPLLGGVPEAWQVQRLKQICRFSYGDSLPTEARQEGVVPVFGSNGRVGFHSLPNTKAPCIVIGRKGSFGKVNFSADQVFAIDTTFFVDSRFTTTNIRWLFYLLGSLRLDQVSKDSAIAGLDREDAYQYLAALPPLSDQTAIVRFLNHADRRIRRLVSAKRKLIALLNEQKQVIIHRAVTRGLDPNVRLKPSGVEWLGDVPEHWELRRLGALLSERGETNEDGNETQVLSLLRNVGVIPYEEKGHFGNKKSEDTTRYKLVRPNDIVVNSMNVIIGSVGLSRHAGCLSPVYYVLVPRFVRDDPRYLNLIFQCKSFQRSLVGLGNGILAHRMRIPMELLKNELMPRPPVEEQLAIVRAISDMTSGSDDTMARTETEVALLREYHTRLVEDVVTGKLDVREAASHLPDESAELEPIDDAESLTSDDGAAHATDLDATSDDTAA